MFSISDPNIFYSSTARVTARTNKNICLMNSYHIASAVEKSRIDFVLEVMGQ
jgi:hypothetical protein